MPKRFLRTEARSHAYVKMRAVDAGRFVREFKKEYVCRMLTSARVKNAVYSCKSRQEMVNVTREYLLGSSEFLVEEHG